MRELSLHILDIIQNSVSAGATMITVTLNVDNETGMLEINIEDNGCGMDDSFLDRVTDPFSTTRTTRKVGLGIPLYKASAEQSGGSFKITSQKGRGTTVTAIFAVDNIDRPPLGDLAGIITDMAAMYEGIEIKLLLVNGEKRFVFDSAEIRKYLGDVPLSEFQVLKWLREFIGEGIKDSFGGVLNEIDS